MRTLPQARVSLLFKEKEIKKKVKDISFFLRKFVVVPLFILKVLIIFLHGACKPHLVKNTFTVDILVIMHYAI